jgi:hypothetical protein
LLIEVKSRNDCLSSSFKVFEKYLPRAKNIQAAGEINKEKTCPDKTEIKKLSSWLAGPNLRPFIN